MRIKKTLGLTMMFLAISTLALAQGGASDGASQAPQVVPSGAYEAVLPLPAATPTVILTFCPGGEPFQGAWLEEGGNKFVGEMTGKKIDGDVFYFTVQAGPGIWDFKCSIEGDTLKGTVTGDYATSPFEGKRVALEVANYCSEKFESDKKAAETADAGGPMAGGAPGAAPGGDGPPGAASAGGAQDAAARIDISGAYKTVLVFPKASPTAYLIFCPGGEPFQGAWLEEGGKKFVNEMIDKKVDGNTLYFTVPAGPGTWYFKCSLEGNILKGTVTGDYATSSFEAVPVELDVANYCSEQFEADKKAAETADAGGPMSDGPPGAPQ